MLNSVGHTLSKKIRVTLNMIFVGGIQFLKAEHNRLNGKSAMCLLLKRYFLKKIDYEMLNLLFIKTTVSFPPTKCLSNVIDLSLVTENITSLFSAAF